MKRPCPSTCDARDCNERSAKMPELRFWAVGHAPGSHPPMSMPLGFAVCTAHAGAEAEPDLIDMGYGLATSFAKEHRAAPPDKATAQVHWWDVGDPEAPHRRLWAKLQ